MTESFRVWAPTASEVELVAEGSGVYPMRGEPEGWWSTSVEEPVTDYGFLIDGAGPFPDPRSRWQPNGVHGLSRTFDSAHHRWEHDAWTGRQLAGSVIYELHVGTFTPEGTLDAAVGRLSHLMELGIDFVELLRGTFHPGGTLGSACGQLLHLDGLGNRLVRAAPVDPLHRTPNLGLGGLLLVAVHGGFGRSAAYQRFVDACHGLGIGVIQDV